MPTEPSTATASSASDPEVVPDPAAPDAAPDPAVPEVVRARLARWRDPDPMSWVAVTVVVMIAAALRLINLAHPKGKLFDEVYYAIDAHQLLKHGVEYEVKVDKGIETELNYPRYAMHPPLGKWCIALGEKLFGYNEFGWRIMAVVFGVGSVLALVLVARRLFRSTLLGCAAGLLMALDGLHLVLSRSALLDIFLMAFLIAAFGCLVYDRDRRRQRWLEALEAGLDPSTPERGGRPALGFPWWRAAAAVLTGCALAVKWSALWYLFLFLFLIVVWEAGTRRTAGARRPWADAVVTQAGWLAGFVVVTLGVYLATWTGWFVTDDGYFRHWLADNGHAEPPVVGALRNLWHYQTSVYRSHLTLTSHHDYQSWPWQWLLLGRPVLFSYSTAQGCGAASCASTVLLLGTPVLWWSFLPALGAMSWLGVARRDWRTLAIGLGAAVGIVPWFWNEIGNRTMFNFYALPSEPYLILAVVYVLGVIIGPGADPVARRRLGVAIAAGYLLVVAACFAYFYPIFTGGNLTYAQWLSRMWLGNRWI